MQEVVRAQEKSRTLHAVEPGGDRSARGMAGRHLVFDKVCSEEHQAVEDRLHDPRILILHTISAAKQSNDGEEMNGRELTWGESGGATLAAHVHTFTRALPLR